MKTKQIFSHALVLVAGLLIGTFFISKNYFIPPTAPTIPAKEAKEYFENYRKKMGYENTKDTISGYFDISKETLDELGRNVTEKKVRVYFGENDSPEELKTYLILNDIDGNGREKESEKLKILSVDITKNECPKYCDIKSTYLYNLK